MYVFTHGIHTSFLYMLKNKGKVQSKYQSRDKRKLSRRKIALCGKDVADSNLQGIKSELLEKYKQAGQGKEVNKEMF